ncbi:hypothetical protein BHE74_00054111 [Ensete ventricosum]|nr:hypothetical protein BHE74_00054111 [Ensete ventricosum]
MAKSVSRELLECKGEAKGTSDSSERDPRVTFSFEREVVAAAKIWAVLSGPPPALLSDPSGDHFFFFFLIFLVSVAPGFATATRGRLRTVMLAWSVRQPRSKDAGAYDLGELDQALFSSLDEQDHSISGQEQRRESLSITLSFF